MVLALGDRIMNYFNFLLFSYLDFLSYGEHEYYFIGY